MLGVTPKDFQFFQRLWISKLAAMTTEFDGFFKDAFDDLTRIMGESLTYRPRAGGTSIDGNRQPGSAASFFIK